MLKATDILSKRRSDVACIQLGGNWSEYDAYFRPEAKTDLYISVIYNSEWTVHCERTHKNEGSNFNLEIDLYKYILFRICDIVLIFRYLIIIIIIY